MRILDENGLYDPANNHYLINLAGLVNGGAGIEAGKGSLDLAKAMKDNNIGDGQDKILIRILKYRVVGNPGDSITINKLYFAAANSDDVVVPPVTENTTTTKGDDGATTTTAGGNGTTTTAKSTDSPKTGDASSVAVMAVVAVAAASGILAFSKKKSK